MGQKAKELMQEWVQIHPMPPPDWMEMLESVSMDARSTLPGASEVSEMYSWQLGPDADYTFRGPYYRLTAWFSIIPAIRHKVGAWASCSNIEASFQ